MSKSEQSRGVKSRWKILIEVGFIIFLFYSNLLMGEFTRVNGRGKSFTFAFKDIFSPTNLVIAVVSGVFGYIGFEYLRRSSE